MTRKITLNDLEKLWSLPITCLVTEILLFSEVNYASIWSRSMQIEEEHFYVCFKNTTYQI